MRVRFECVCVCNVVCVLCASASDSEPLANARSAPHVGKFVGEERCISCDDGVNVV